MSDALVKEMADVKERLAVIESKVNDMHKAIMGNGSPGLIQRVTKNETILSGVVFVSGLILAAVVSLIFGWIGK